MWFEICLLTIPDNIHSLEIEKMEKIRLKRKFFQNDYHLETVLKMRKKTMIIIGTCQKLQKTEVSKRKGGKLFKK